MAYEMTYEKFKRLKTRELQNKKLAEILNNEGYALECNYTADAWSPNDIDIIEGLRADGQLETRLNAPEVTAKLTKGTPFSADVAIAVQNLRTALLNSDSNLSQSLSQTYAATIIHRQPNSNSIWTKPAPRIGAALTILGGTSLAALLLVVQFAHVIPPFALALYILAAAVALIGLATLGISAAVHCYGASKASYSKL